MRIRIPSAHQGERMLKSLQDFEKNITKENWDKLFELIGSKKILYVMYHLGDSQHPASVANNCGISESLAREAYFLYHGEHYREQDDAFCWCCNGTGVDPLFKLNVCPECRGSGLGSF